MKLNARYNHETHWWVYPIADDGNRLESGRVRKSLVGLTPTPTTHGRSSQQTAMASVSKTDELKSLTGSTPVPSAL